MTCELKYFANALHKAKSFLSNIDTTFKMGTLFITTILLNTFAFKSLFPSTETVFQTTTSNLTFRSIFKSIFILLNHFGENVNDLMPLIVPNFTLNNFETANVDQRKVNTENDLIGTSLSIKYSFCL
jgi:hypothetical protein